MAGYFLGDIIQLGILLLMLGTFLQNQKVTNITMEAAQTTIDAAKDEEIARIQRSHEFLLTSQPLSDLRRSVLHPTMFYLGSWVHPVNFEIRVPQMKIVWESRRSELFFQHLVEGYPDLLKSINVYEELYNNKVQTFSELLKEGVELLKVNLINKTRPRDGIR